MRHHLVQVRVHGLGRGGHIGVVRVKNFRIYRVAELHQGAVRTKRHAQRQGDFVIGHLLRLEKIIRQRSPAEVEDEFEVF